jgi:hypothetical protein
VLRVKRPPLDHEDIAWEHRLVARLAGRLDEVQAPLAGRDGRTWFAWKDRAAWMLPFVPGAPADAGREADRLAAASALGRLHAAGAGLELGPRPRLAPLRRMPWPRLPRRLLPGQRARRGRPRDRHRRLGGGARGLGDVGARDRDVVVLPPRRRARRRPRQAFAAAYRAAGGSAPEADDDLLLPLARVKRILEVLRARTDRDPQWDLQRENLRALAHLPTRPG